MNFRSILSTIFLVLILSLTIFLLFATINTSKRASILSDKANRLILKLDKIESKGK